ncbi:MAG: phospholipase D-like domain-containing protein, partial [bacterium]
MKRIIFFIFIGFISAYSLSWDVYFSQSVDTTFATTTNARGNVDLRQIVKNIIDSSSLTIDICVYSISSIQIVRSIINAKNRGVMVRIITDQSTISAPEIDSLEASGIRVISQLFGRYTSSSLMHNKFILVDFGDTTREVLVVGSFNFTDIRNADNMIVIRNAHSLMENYYREFNQMWGSTVGIPDSSRSVFERYKSEITPHMFTIDGKIVEQYFLPKDSLAEVLRRVIRGAQKEIYFSVYAFTLTDVRDVMRAMHDSIGVVVKGVIDARSFSLSVGPSMTGWAYVYSDSAYYLL